MTTPIYIDNQTLAGVIIALDLGNPTQWTGWVTQSALISTCVLITLENVRVSPPAHYNTETVRAYAGVSGYYDILGKSLAHLIKAYTPPLEIKKKATNTVISWANKNPATIREAFEKIKSNENYESWIDYEVRKGWPTATAILNGLVEDNFIRPISKAMNINANNLYAVLNDSRNIQKVNTWSKNSYNGEDKELAKLLFAFGALLRGRYHDRVAELFGSTIYHHPFRDGVLKQPKTIIDSKFKASNTLEYIGKIVLASSLTERKIENRIKLWASNVEKLRNALVYTNSISVPNYDIYDDVAIKKAAEAVKSCNIAINNKFFYSIVHHALGLGTGAATSFLLDPWFFIAGWIGSEMITHSIENGLLPYLHNSTNRLEKLAHTIPGRLRRLPQTL